MPGQEVEGVEGEGIHESATGDTQERELEDEESPHGGTTMTPGGAMPSGGAMDHWATAMPNTDVLKSETMPNTESTPLPGETEDRDAV